MSEWFAMAMPLGPEDWSRRLQVNAADWSRAATELSAAGARLLGLWAESAADAGRTSLQLALMLDCGLLLLELPWPDQGQAWPAIDALFPAAARMQRTIFDLHGLRCSADDQRPWLRHRAWSEAVFPLSGALMPAPPPEPPVDTYPFVRVDGDGVHEIAVGPVHAGIIEPGHFRFSVVGEKVLRLEQHLGYVHKGIEQRFQGMALNEGYRLAARISGDSAVAFSWAYAQALESLVMVEVPAPALWLRALALELERLANHLGDLGALGNDAGFAFGLSQFGRLKEQLLRRNAAAFGQRYLLDFIVPGGVAMEPQALATLAAAMPGLSEEVQRLREIYDEHAGVRDRFSGAGMVSPALARQLGLTGFAGRASGQAFDLRCDLALAPYAQLAPRRCGSSAGDVAARVAIRFDEVLESARLVEAIVAGLPDGPIVGPVPTPDPGSLALGCIEGWRGPVMIALRAGKEGRIARCHPQDPSWLNWPVLEHAVIGNIVPDFPLINKSFNLSYSGHDL